MAVYLYNTTVIYIVGTCNGGSGGLVSTCISISSKEVGLIVVIVMIIVLLLLFCHYCFCYFCIDVDYSMDTTLVLLYKYFRRWLNTFFFNFIFSVSSIPNACMYFKFVGHSTRRIYS